jgi:uncharacterized membrane protein YkoI
VKFPQPTHSIELINDSLSISSECGYLKTSKDNRGKTMRNKIIVSVLLACGLLASSMALSAVAEETAEKADKANLKEQATVSKSEAKKLALAEVKKRGLHHARIKEAELEKEKGVVIWSFDISTRGTKDITEVQVDAKTGSVVSVTTESARDEAKEKQGGKEKEDDEKNEKKCQVVSALRFDRCQVAQVLSGLWAFCAF